MLQLYTLIEAADMLSLSTRTIYNRIDRVDLGQKYSVNGAIHLTSAQIEILKANKSQRGRKVSIKSTDPTSPPKKVSKADLAYTEMMRQGDVLDKIHATMQEIKNKLNGR